MRPSRRMEAPAEPVMRQKEAHKEERINYRSLSKIVRRAFLNIPMYRTVKLKKSGVQLEKSVMFAVERYSPGYLVPPEL